MITVKTIGVGTNLCQMFIPSVYQSESRPEWLATPHGMVCVSIDFDWLIGRGAMATGERLHWLIIDTCRR